MKKNSVKIITCIFISLLISVGHIYAANLFSHDFSGGTFGAQPGDWSDETQNTNLNTEIAYDYRDGFAGVTMAATETLGQTRLATQVFNVDIYNTLEVVIDYIGSGTVEIGLHDGTVTTYLYSVISSAGTYTADIPTITSLNGDNNLGVVVQINGLDAYVVLDSVRIYGPDTPTFTPTATETHTPTLTPTESATYTITPTETPTLTPSPTPTESATYTVTATETETSTVTPSFTVTESATPTFTDTETPTITPTNTIGDTPTFTSTPTVSPTGSITLTATPTHTETHTPDPAATSTFTQTVTLTWTETHTPLPSATFTVTPSVTETATQAPPSATFTPSPIVSATNTRTVTLTSTRSAQVDVYDASLGDVQVAAKTFTPDSTVNRELMISFRSKEILSDISVGIYSVNGRKHIMLIPEQTPAGYLVRWDGKDEGGQTLSSGIYIYQIKASDSAYRGAVVLVR